MKLWVFLFCQVASFQGSRFFFTIASQDMAEKPILKRAHRSLIFLSTRRTALSGLLCLVKSPTFTNPYRPSDGNVGYVDIYNLL